MTGRDSRTRASRRSNAPDNLVRWECRCQQPPVLLATYDAHGRINIKVRDRYWHIDGVVRTVCPRCGSEHTLDLRGGSRQSEVGGRKSEDRSDRRGNGPPPDS